MLVTSRTLMAKGRSAVEELRHAACHRSYIEAAVVVSGWYGKSVDKSSSTDEQSMYINQEEVILYLRTVKFKVYTAEPLPHLPRSIAATPALFFCLPRMPESASQYASKRVASKCPPATE